MYMIETVAKNLTQAQKYTNNKRSTILVYWDEIQATLPTHSLVILNKFHNDREKIVDFLVRI